MRILFKIIKFFFRLTLALLLLLLTTGLLVAFIRVRGNATTAEFFIRCLLGSDDYIRYVLPHKFHPFGPFIAYVYTKAVYILVNILLSSFEVELYDVTTSYCFNLLLVYQDTNLFIILILSFVYYCLYKIIEEHLYNLYGDSVSVYPYLYGRFRRYLLKFYDFGCSLLEELGKFHFREIALYFKKFFPVSLFFLFDTFNVYKSSKKTAKFRRFGRFEKFMHVYGLWYLKFFIAFCLGSFKGGECFSYARVKKTLNKSLDFKFIKFFDDKIFRNLSPHQYDQIQNDLVSGENVPFLEKKMYYVGKISNANVLYQLFLMSDNKNVYSYDLSSTSAECFRIFDDSFLYSNFYNRKNLNNISLYGSVKNVEMLYNNLLITSSESNPAKNAIDFDEILDSTPERYKSHKVNSYIYLYNRSGKYLSSGVPLNNKFSSHRFIQSMSADVKNTFSFYDVFSIFLSNTFFKSEEVKNLGDPSTYVMLSEPYVISFLSKLGSYNHCQHSLDNGPWYDVVLKAHELVHSFAFEYAWAIFPSSIICYLMVPAYLLLYSLEFFGQAFLMVKIMGHQWFWSYEIENSLANSSSVKFDSNLVTNEEYNKSVESVPSLTLPKTGYYRSGEQIKPKFGTSLAIGASKQAQKLTDALNLSYEVWENYVKGTVPYDWRTDRTKAGVVKAYISLKQNEVKDTFSLPRLLSTDNRLILPAEKPILLSICSTDVLHAFAVPNFGLKVDAVPGRINTFWLYMNKAGIYYGQCSELCGKGHGFMPIVVDSQHYSNNPFSNEILSGQNNPEGILPTASAEAGKGWDDVFPEGYFDPDFVYDHARDCLKGTGNHDWIPHKRFFEDRGYGYYCGDGPTFLIPTIDPMDSYVYLVSESETIVRELSEIIEQYGHLRLEKPYGFVPLDPSTWTCPPPFKHFPASDLALKWINIYTWECLSDPKDRFSVSVCDDVGLWHAWYQWFNRRDDKNMHVHSIFWWQRGFFLMEPLIDGYPPIPCSEVIKTVHRMIVHNSYYLNGFANKLTNWNRFAGYDFEKDIDFVHELDYVGPNVTQSLVTLDRSNVLDPYGLSRNEHKKACASTLEQYKSGCDDMDYYYEVCEKIILEAERYIELAEMHLNKAADSELLTDTFTHRYQVENYKNGNMRELVDEVKEQVAKRKQLFYHAKNQEQNFFRDFEAHKKTAIHLSYA